MSLSFPFYAHQVPDPSLHLIAHVPLDPSNGSPPMNTLFNAIISFVSGLYK
nr:MAG TPA: hypothetical protein [Bacteriophage sp.]